MMRINNVSGTVEPSIIIYACSPRPFIVAEPHYVIGGHTERPAVRILSELALLNRAQQRGGLMKHRE
jgi:hypothetical protein